MAHRKSDLGCAWFGRVPNRFFPLVKAAALVAMVAWYCRPASSQAYTHQYVAVVEPRSLDAHPKMLLIELVEMVPGAMGQMHPGSPKLFLRCPRAVGWAEMSGIAEGAGYELRDFRHDRPHGEHVDLEVLNTYPAQQNTGDQFTDGQQFDAQKAAWIEANPDAYRILTEGPQTAEPAGPTGHDEQDD